jgi:hypothetical protein
MHLNLNTGTIVFLGICVLFYLRLMMLRGHKLKQERAAIAQRRKSGKKAPVDDIKPSYFRPRYEITSWWIVAPALILMVLGLTITSTSLLPAVLKPYDWMFIAAGGVLFIFGFK